MTEKATFGAGCFWGVEVDFRNRSSHRGERCFERWVRGNQRRLLAPGGHLPDGPADDPALL